MHGNMYEDRGEMISTFIVCFALSSSVSGYTSGSFYRLYLLYTLFMIYADNFFSEYRQYFTSARVESTSQWQLTMITTILLFPLIVCVMIFMINCVAIYYDTLSAIPLSVIIKMIAIWLFVSLPLSIVGTVVGRHWMGKYEPPCRVNSIPR